MGKGGEGSEFDWAISEKPQQKTFIQYTNFYFVLSNVKKKQLMFD